MLDYLFTMPKVQSPMQAAPPSLLLSTEVFPNCSFCTTEEGRGFFLVLGFSCKFGLSLLQPPNLPGGILCLTLRRRELSLEPGHLGRQGLLFFGWFCQLYRLPLR